MDEIVREWTGEGARPGFRAGEREMRAQRQTYRPLLK